MLLVALHKTADAASFRQTNEVSHVLDPVRPRLHDGELEGHQTGLPRRLLQPYRSVGTAATQQRSLMENNGGEIEDRRLPWGPNGTRRATGASNGVKYGVSDEELCGARVEVLRVVHRSPSGGACTRQVHADNTRGASGGRARAHLLFGSACGPTAVRRALHGHTHTTLPACGRTRLGPATRARFPEAAADAETAIAGCGSRCGQPNLVTTSPLN